MMGDGTSARLRERVARAIEQVDGLRAQYEQLLSDPGVIQEDRDAVGLLLEHARQQLTAAQDAVVRWEDGSYGVCSRCGASIGDERLSALPDVTTCVTCAG